MPEHRSNAFIPMSHLPTAETLVGAMNPLWGYFAGAALVGMAWWWATRWTLLSAPAAALEASELSATLEALAAEPAAMPVGGEAAPISPAALERMVAAEPRPRPPKPREGEARPH